MFAIMLTVCMSVSVMPSVTFAAEKENSFVPKRIFIEGEQPDEEMSQKVSLAASEFAAKGLSGNLPIVYGDRALEEAGDLVVAAGSGEETNRTGQMYPSSGYSIEVEDGDVVKVQAKNSTGILYAMRDIMKTMDLDQQVADKEQTFDTEQRIFHLDCGRKYFSKEWMISLIKELSWLEMNELELDFSNGTGFRFALDDMNLDVNGEKVDLSVLPGGTTDPSSYLTQADMDEILATAEEYSIEVVPCLDTPGHSGWIVGKDSLSKYGSGGEIDVENASSVAFAKALVKKYAAYFEEKGCRTFHLGGDEYLHAYYNWGTPMPSTEGKYAAVATYLDGLALELKDMGYTKIRSFNDPLYYKEDTTTHTYQNIDEASYWCRSMGGFNYASPTTLASQGLHMINGHGDFYDIMTDDNWQKPVGDAGTKKTPAGIYAQFQNNTFAGSVSVEDSCVYGSTYFLWCDNAGGGTQEQVIYSLYPRLRAAAEKMKNENASGTYEAFAQTFTDSIGGFKVEGTTGKLDTTVLPKAEEIKPAISEEQLAADAVIEKINALKDVTYDSKEQIEEVRKAYDALSEDAKKLVDAETVKKLTDAEEAWKKLEETWKKEHDLTQATLSEIPQQKYTGSALTPEVTVTLAGKTLTEDQDYLVAYAANTYPGTASVIVIGKGDYHGSISTTFQIVKDASGDDKKDENKDDDKKDNANDNKNDSKDPEKTVPVKGGVYDVGGAKYRVLDAAVDGKGKAALTKVPSSATNVIVPANVTINGISYQVTQIAAKALNNNAKVKKLTIGKNVAKIGNKAFYNCKNLKNIKINTKKLTSKSVGTKAFGKLSAKVTVKVPSAKKKAYKQLLVKKGLSKKAKIK